MGAGGVGGAGVPPRPTPAFWGLTLFALLFALSMTSVMVSGRRLENYDQLSSLGLVHGAGYCALAAGVLSRWYRPENRMGLLLVWLSIGQFSEDLQIVEQPLIHAVGLALTSASAGIGLHTVLAHPLGRLSGALDRLGVGAAYLTSLVAATLLLPGMWSSRGNVLQVAPDISERPETWLHYPQPLVVFYSAPLGMSADTLLEDLNGAIGILALLLCTRRLVTVDSISRRAVAPVIAATLTAGVCAVLRPYFQGLPLPGAPGRPTLMFTLVSTGYRVLPWPFRYSSSSGCCGLCDLHGPSRSCANRWTALGRQPSRTSSGPGWATPVLCSSFRAPTPS